MSNKADRPTRRLIHRLTQPETLPAEQIEKLTTRKARRAALATNRRNKNVEAISNS